MLLKQCDLDQGLALLPSQKLSLLFLQLRALSSRASCTSIELPLREMIDAHIRDPRPSRVDRQNVLRGEASSIVLQAIAHG